MAEIKRSSYYPTALQGALGLYQTVAGLSTPKPKRPVREVQPGFREAASIAQRQAQATTDAALVDQNADIDRSVAQGIYAANKTGATQQQVLGTLGALNSQALQAKQNAGGAFDQRQQQRQGVYGQALNTLGLEQARNFEYNQAQRHDEETAARSAYIEGGLQNLSGAAGDYALLKQVENNPQQTESPPVTQNGTYQFGQNPLPGSAEYLKRKQNMTLGMSKGLYIPQSLKDYYGIL